MGDQSEIMSDPDETQFVEPPKPNKPTLDKTQRLDTGNRSLAESTQMESSDANERKVDSDDQC